MVLKLTHQLFADTFAGYGVLRDVAFQALLVSGRASKISKPAPISCSRQHFRQRPLELGLGEARRRSGVAATAPSPKVLKLVTVAGNLVKIRNVTQPQSKENIRSVENPGKGISLDLSICRTRRGRASAVPGP